MNNSDFRVISDMVRYEKNEVGDVKPNYEAGIDLLEILFKKLHYRY